MKSQSTQYPIFTIYVVGLMLSIIIPRGAFAQASVRDTISSKGTNWTKVVYMWLEFVNYPSDELNANSVLLSLPSCRDSIDRYANNFGLANYVIWRFTDVLRTQVTKGKSAAIEIAFRVSHFSDADLSEQLSALFGDLVRSRPRLFLQSLRLHRCPNTPLEFYLIGVDSNISDERQELLARVRSLRTVRDSSLIPLRNLCIEVIKTKFIDVRESDAKFEFDAKFNRIELGMTIEKVRSVLGEPFQVRVGVPKKIYSSGEIEIDGQAWFTTWFYYKPQPNLDVIKVYMVIFEKSNNLVKEKMRDDVLGSLTFKELKE